MIKVSVHDTTCLPGTYAHLGLPSDFFSFLLCIFNKFFVESELSKRICLVQSKNDGATDNQDDTDTKPNGPLLEQG